MFQTQSAVIKFTADFFVHTIVKNAEIIEF